MRPASLSSLVRPYMCRACKSSLCRDRTYVTIASSPDLYDVICVGGGPVGLSLLAALRASSITSTLKLALIESQDLSQFSNWSLPTDRFSNRASSLTATSKSFLDKIGVWPHLDNSRVQPYERIQVWDGVSDARIVFDWEESEGPSPIAYMTENANLVRGLLARLADLAPITMLDKTCVSSITLGPSAVSEPSAPNLSSWPHLTLSNTSNPLIARLLVGADGLNSPVRSFASIPSRGWDYGRHALVATVSLVAQEFYSESPRTAYQRFLPTGPIALLALPGTHATLVWSTLPEYAAHLKTLTPRDLAAMINAAFRLRPVDLDYLHTIPSGQVDELDWRLRHTRTLAEGVEVPYMVDTVQEGSVASFPLRMRHADSYSGERVALVGDAAHTIHPLAGQGLNMGLGDAQALFRIIEDTVRYGGDIGSGMRLEGYGAERYSTNNRLLGVVDKLHKLYSYGSGPIVGARSLGLGAVDSFTGLKRLIMGAASG